VLAQVALELVVLRLFGKSVNVICNFLALVVRCVDLRQKGIAYVLLALSGFRRV
jgi:hypothetical protein